MHDKNTAFGAQTRFILYFRDFVIFIYSIFFLTNLITFLDRVSDSKLYPWVLGVQELAVGSGVYHVT